MSERLRFQQLCQDAKSRIREISAAAAASALADGAILIDVREGSDFQEEHAVGAVHLSKGVVEMKIEETVPNNLTPIVCYCGGGNRSALVAVNLQNMGYQNVCSLTGGFKAWKEAGLPVEAEGQKTEP